MANNKIDLGCPQTRGTFQIRGVVSGVESQNFYSEGTGQNGKPYRKVNFSVEVEKDKKIFISLFGAVQDNVYFSKSEKDDSGKSKTETRAVKWADRMSFKADGFRLIGVNVGLSKKINSDGREVNDSKNLTAYDACGELRNLEDNMSVFIQGNVTYSTYKGRHMTNFEPTQISLTSKPIDLEAEDFKPHALFTQPLVYMGISKNEEKPGEAVISAKIVNYNTIEDTELYTRNPRLAKVISKQKPYTFIKLFGDILVESTIEEVEEEDEWGEPNKMERVASPYVRKLLVTGGDKESVDTETYSEGVIDKAMSIINANNRAKSDYGAKSDDEDWGNNSMGDIDDDDDDFDIDDL